jgi:hypothetical protein
MDAYERMTVTVPEGEMDGVRVERFTIEERDVHNLRNSLRGRGTAPGTYTRLTQNGSIWMSDVDAEKGDHLSAVWKIQDPNVRRVLINGLGLGMILNAALSFDHVEHVDVVEIDERIVKLVGSHYANDPRVTIHHADAYEQTKRWPSGTRWDVGWSDIWGDISTDDLTTMATMNRSYGRRCTWHECWGYWLLKEQQRREKAEERRLSAYWH